MDSNGRVFEDFVPPHSMVREPATHTLTVDLTAAGYKKEHIRVQMVHSHRRLLVRGERPVAGNRWSRFRLELRVPDGCNAKAIHARFENGVVRVTMPGIAPEPVQVETGAAGHQQDPSPQAKTAAAPSAAQDQKDAAAQQQDGDRAARAGGVEDEGGKKDEAAAQKQEMRQRPVSSPKDGGHDHDDAGGAGEVTAASPPRQGFGFLYDQRRKMATTVLGVVLVLISLGIYVKYSLWP
ncbi:hypothetical protein PAHAL_9G240900 [Panicum hallii]|uniref:SHSP domain-containing protein n=1 Tax=Panicum hallii TaxID=206008 RepID=A0A2S3IM01_9POAL|nr:inactive protein RESTRICTED TEV MOVEMENT 2-like [Panicum hallii]PAN47188.1 hypothetical protein PAHAL_9G240900 [Panicum hallii]